MAPCVPANAPRSKPSASSLSVLHLWHVAERWVGAEVGAFDMSFRQLPMDARRRSLLSIHPSLALPRNV